MLHVGSMTPLRFAALVLVGCATEPEIGTTTTTAAPVGAMDPAAASSAIAQAHCARAQACGAYTSRGIYRDADYCEADLLRSTLDELDRDYCRSVDFARLTTCIEAVRSESCADLNFTEKAPPECNRAVLCR